MPGPLFPSALLLVVILSGCIGSGSPAATGPLFPLPWDEILLDWPYPDLDVEIDYVEPYVPSELALDELLHVLETHTVKKKVRILEPTPIPPESGSYTAEDLYAIHDRTQDAHDGGTAATLHILYLNGRMKEFDYLGVQFVNDAVALFPMYFDLQTVGPLRVEHSGLGLNREEMERAVLAHEVGHLMGLVNDGVPMVRAREDPDHPSHSLNRESVMYYTVDVGRGGLEDAFSDDFVFEFDEDDKRDLRAFIEKRRALLAAR